MVNPKVKEFVRQFYPIARDVCRAYSKPGAIIPAIACLAQCAQETGWNLNPKGGVFFGVKAPLNSNSPTVTTGTWEDGAGGRERIQAAFLSYKGFADACKGYCEFITQNPRYKKALTLGKGIPERYLFYVRYTVTGSGDEKETGYATDRYYYNFCSSHIQTILAALQELGMQEG